MPSKRDSDPQALQEEVIPWERNFREQMIRIREEKNLTQTELARRLSKWGLPFHQQTVQRVEAGQRPVRLNEALLIARELDVSLDAMMTTGTPNARAMIYAVDEMRRGSDRFASDIVESMSEWAETVAGLVLAVDELLQQYDGTRQDPVLKYGYTWANRAWDAYANLSNGLQQLVDLSEGREAPPRYHFDELDHMEPWWDAHDGLYTSEEFPSAPSSDDDALPAAGAILTQEQLAELAARAEALDDARVREAVERQNELDRQDSKDKRDAKPSS